MNKQTSEIQLIIERTFDAPRELLWKIWTDPNHIKQWYCPHGFHLSHYEGQIKVGGKYLLCMVSPEGDEYWLGGEYKEVYEPERLVYTHIWQQGVDVDLQYDSEVTVILQEVESKTRMIFKQYGFVSEASRNDHEKGWSECFEKLDNLLQKG